MQQFIFESFEISLKNFTFRKFHDRVYRGVYNLQSVSFCNNTNTYWNVTDLSTNHDPILFLSKILHKLSFLFHSHMKSGWLNANVFRLLGHCVDIIDQSLGFGGFGEADFYIRHRVLRWEDTIGMIATLPFVINLYAHMYLVYLGDFFQFAQGLRHIQFYQYLHQKILTCYVN